MLAHSSWVMIAAMRRVCSELVSDRQRLRAAMPILDLLRTRGIEPVLAGIASAWHLPGRCGGLGGDEVADSMGMA